MFAQLSSFKGNTAYRGKIVWFLITCRPDLLPVDLKRQGRAEEHLALFYPETQEEHDLLSVAICAEQCDDLLSNGVGQVHLYTLNKPELPWRVCRALGIEPEPVHVAASCG